MFLYFRITDRQLFVDRGDVLLRVGEIEVSHLGKKKDIDAVIAAGNFCFFSKPLCSKAKMSHSC